MSSSTFSRYLTPWKFRREQEAHRLAALRQRDGDDCRRCRRPLRFDLPPGHDLGPRVERIADGAAREIGPIDNLCLTHGRCHAQAGDDTREVTERMRRKAEAELFVKSRERRRA